MGGQYPDGDGAIQVGVRGFVDFAYPSGAEGGVDLVGAEGGDRRKWHGYRPVGTRALSSSSHLYTTLTRSWVTLPLNIRKR